MLASVAGREGAAILIELGRVVVVSGAVGSAMIRAFGFLRQLWCERWRVVAWSRIAYCIIPPGWCHRVYCVLYVLYLYFVLIRITYC